MLSNSGQSGFVLALLVPAFFGSLFFKANPAVSRSEESLAKQMVILQKQSMTGLN